MDQLVFIMLDIDRMSYAKLNLKLNCHVDIGDGV